MSGFIEKEWWQTLSTFMTLLTFSEKRIVEQILQFIRNRDPSGEHILW